MVTIEEFRDRLLKICLEHPNRRNPQDVSGQCIYTNPINHDHHCIVGQYIAEYYPDHDLDDFEGHNGGEVLATIDSDFNDLVDEINKLQFVADNQEGNKPLKWKKLGLYILENWLEA